jgi:hypothetical protein
MGFNSFFIFSSGLEKHPVKDVEKLACVTIDDWLKFTRIMMIIDMFLTMVLPFLLITLFNILIIVKLKKKNNSFEFFLNKSVLLFSSVQPISSKSSRKSAKCSVKSSERITTSHVNELSPIKPNEVTKKPSMLQKARYSISIRWRNQTNLMLINSRKKFNFYKRTYILILISTCFLCMNTPMALCKLWYFIKPSSSYTLNSTEEILERFSCYVYYLNFCINFFLYNLKFSKLKLIFTKQTKKNKLY